MNLYEVRVYLDGSQGGVGFLAWTFWADDVSHAVEQFMDDPAVYEDCESSRWEIRQVKEEV
jgi:hypothetical protein